VFENGVLGKRFEPKRDEKAREWKYCIMKSFVIYIPYQILLGSNQEE
jgi:hypothetical protein